MTVLIGSTWVRYGTGISRVGAREIVRQAHGARLAQNEHRFRSTTQATPIAWAGRFSTASTSYVTVFEGLWRAGYNIAIPTAFGLETVETTDNLDLRWTLSAVGGGSAVTYTRSAGAGPVTTSTAITYSSGSPLADTTYRVKLEAKVPAAGTGYLWGARVDQVDAIASALY